MTAFCFLCLYCAKFWKAIEDCAGNPGVYLIHSEPTLKSRSHAALARTMKYNPSVVRKRANNRTSHDDFPLPL